MGNDVPDVERMTDFFNRRVASYDEHMRRSVAKVRRFLSEHRWAHQANGGADRRAGSEFPIEPARWDYIVSVMAVHHLAHEEKFRLY